MVEVVQLRKHFLGERGAVKALDGVSFSVPDGTLLTLLGPSGCGKTTTLRCVAGLERPEEGTITIGGQMVYSNSTGRFIPPEKRQIGMVFQSYAIWPHMTVFDNVAYPLQGKKLNRSEISKKVSAVLDLVGLGHLADRPAPNLSGGQQQRVALARALVAEPKVLLLDEPLSNLDAKLRQQMRTEIRRLQQHTGVTAIYVTHDQEEALAVSDEVVFMSDGKLIERGQPEQMYMRPQQKLTAEFLGEANFLPGEVNGTNGNYLTVTTPGGTLLCRPRPGVDRSVSVFFRPEMPRIEFTQPPNGAYLRGTVKQTLFLGKSVTSWVDVGAERPIKVDAPPVNYPQVGDQIYLIMEPDDCAVYEPGAAASLEPTT